MKLLLDTSVWLWLITNPERLSDSRRHQLASIDTVRLLSLGSLWEICIKYAAGKLPLPQQPWAYVPGLLVETRTTPIAIEQSHVFRVAQLPLHHRDPFDRLLIAQAQIERIPIVTSDPWFSKYDVEVLSPV